MSIKLCNFDMQAMCLHIKVTELNTPSDGNSAYQDISQIRHFKNGL